MTLVALVQVFGEEESGLSQWDPAEVVSGVWFVGSGPGSSRVLGQPRQAEEG